MARVNEELHIFAAFTSQLKSFTVLSPVFISRPTEGRRLSWLGWLVNPLMHKVAKTVM